MPKIKNRIFVITLKIEGVTHYFEHEEIGTIDPKTHATIKEPTGYFTRDLKEAQKYRDKWHAEMVASAYKGAGVESISIVER